MIDLDKAKQDRFAKAAAREGFAPEGFDLVFGGKTIATLPAELPLSALAPLRRIDEEIALLIRYAMDVARQGGDDKGRAESIAALTGMIVDLLATTRDLPQTLLDVVREIAVALLGADGLDAFLAARPSISDVSALISGLLGMYGVSLGESLRSNVSPENDGPTSSPTSSAIATESTPDASGVPQDIPTSSASAA